MPPWDELFLPWQELSFLPAAWKTRLSDWNGIYLITDKGDGKAYVGSAYGREGLLQRWLDYKNSGDGGNKALKKRNPNNFLFTILERLPPDMPKDEVVRREVTWKIRLHTRELGLTEH